MNKLSMIPIGTLAFFLGAPAYATTAGDIPALTAAVQAACPAIWEDVKSDLDMSMVGADVWQADADDRVAFIGHLEQATAPNTPDAVTLDEMASDLSTVAGECAMQRTALMGALVGRFPNDLIVASNETATTLAAVTTPPAGDSSQTRSGGSSSQLSRTGASVDWAQRDNARGSDDLYADNKRLDTGAYTKYLYLSQYGFGIPPGATVTGIEVFVEGHLVAPAQITIDEIRLVKDGLIVGENRARGETWSETPDEIKVYGSATDTWGETWTDVDINDPDLGVAVSLISAIDGDYRIKIDDIYLKVHYSE